MLFFINYIDSMYSYNFDLHKNKKRNEDLGIGNILFFICNLEE